MKKKGKGHSDISERLLKDTKNKLGTNFIESGDACYNIKDNTIYGNKDSAALISHEIGHAHYHRDKDAGKVGKISHNLYKKLGGGYSFSKLAPMSGIGTGIASGINKAKREERGEKESKLNKALPYLVPLAVTAPGLISEAAASRHGLKLLKKHGVDKNTLKKVKRSYGTAFGTYATSAASSSALGGLSKYGSYKLYKGLNEDESNKKEKKTNVIKRNK